MFLVKPSREPGGSRRVLLLLDAVDGVAGADVELAVVVFAEGEDGVRTDLRGEIDDRAGLAAVDGERLDVAEAGVGVEVGPAELRDRAATIDVAADDRVAGGVLLRLDDHRLGEPARIAVD